MPKKKNIRRQSGTRSRPQKDKSLHEAQEKAPEEPRMIGLRALAAGSSTVGCWFKDASGGPDFCVPMPSADACTNAGGSPTAGGCPNTNWPFWRLILQT
jgi:hypothetical protein